MYNSFPWKFEKNTNSIMQSMCFPLFAEEVETEENMPRSTLPRTSRIQTIHKPHAGQFC